MKKCGLIMRKGYRIQADHIETLRRYTAGICLVTLEESAQQDARFSRVLTLSQVAADEDNVQRVAKFAQEHDLTGFVTFQETDIIFTSLVNAALGNVRLGQVEVARICRDKSKQRAFLQMHHIPSPAFQKIDSAEQLALVSIPFPLIIKPTTAASSSNVCLVRNLGELKQQYAIIQAQTDPYYYPSGHAEVIVEEFLTGDEYTVDGVVLDGKFVLGGVHRKDRMPGPYFEENNYMLPCGEADEEFRVIAEQIVRKLVLHCSLFNVELRRDARGELKVVEFSNRISGGHVYRNVRDVYTIDLVGAFIVHALDEPDALQDVLTTRSLPRVRTLIRFIYREGRVLRNQVGEAAADVALRAYYPLASAGSIVHSAPRGFDIVGLLSVMVQADATDGELCLAADRVEHLLDLVVVNKDEAVADPVNAAEIGAGT
jgi:biotin carboxylase